MDFSGRIEAFPPGDLLQWAKNERRTGALVFRRSEREKRVYFLKGSVIGCLSNDPAEYFGQHLLLRGSIDEEQLFRGLTHCTRSGGRLGAALSELGILDAGSVQVALREQIEDLICDLFLWEHGVFYFEPEMPADEEILPEPIDTMGLVLEGSRWVDERARMRSVFVHEGVILKRGRRYPLVGAEPLRQKVLETVDGKKTLRDIYSTVRGSYFRFLEAAFRLCVDEVLDIEDVGEPMESGTLQLSVLDLLLERAAEEQALIARRHMAIPLDLLERSVPLWVHPPSDEERARMPSRARDFYARLDGETALGDAFSGDHRLRGKEMDLLLLQLQKGRLAILPAALSVLDRQVASSEPRDATQGETATRRWWRRVTSPKG